MEDVFVVNNHVTRSTIRQYSLIHSIQLSLLHVLNVLTVGDIRQRKPRRGSWLTVDDWDL